MIKRKKVNLKKNYFYSLVYQIITIIIPLITTPYVSRVLGPENIGIYSFVNANLISFVVFGGFGLSTYSQFEVAKIRDEKKMLNQFCVESLITRLFTVGISLIIYIFVYFFIFNEYRVYYLVCICALIANAIDVTWIFQGLEDFETVAIHNTIIRTLGVLLIFLLVKSPNDLLLYFLINSSTSLLSNLSLFPSVKKYLYIDHFCFCGIIPHIKKSLIYMLPSVASILITTTDKLMIGWYGVGMDQNGYYEQAMKVENIIFMPFAALNIAMRPRMAYLYKNSKIIEIDNYLIHSLSFVSFLAMPMLFGMLLVSDLFVPCFFGSGFEGTVILLNIMSFWILFKSISNCILEQCIVPKGGQVIATKILWYAAFANVLMNIMLIPKLFSTGAALASLFTEFIILGFTMYYSKSNINIKKIAILLWKPALSSLAMFSIMTAVKYRFNNSVLQLVFLIVLSCFIYLCFEFVLKDKFLLDGFKLLKLCIHKL